MYYYLVGILAILILFIINYDVLFKTPEGHDLPARKEYRRFLFGVLAYYVTDALWGIFDILQLHLAIYIDTVVYFLAMAAAVLFWTRYVIRYLGERSGFASFLSIAGRVFFAFEAIVVIANFFYPFLFWFEEGGAYHTGIARHITLGLQILMFLLTAVYMTYESHKKAEKSGSRRYRTIGLFGIAMMIMIAVQMAYPLLPFYSMGYMLGTCLIHTFVIEDEKEEIRKNLKASAEREEKQRIELGVARHKAYTDSLTGVKNKHAYAEYEDLMETRIAKNDAFEFAVAVFDVNDLKKINDTMGHEFGDQYIISASRLICNQFQYSPVFRIGGDEFVAVLERDDFRQREALCESFDMQIETNLREKKVVIALGVSAYIPFHDNSFRRVFERADQQMYHRKQELKDREAHLTRSLD